MNPKKLWQALKRSFTQFSEDNVLTLAASLAYYAMFSIGPLLVIAVGVAGLVMGKQEVRHQVHDQLQSLLGANSAKTVESMMAAQKHGSSLITTIVGIVALLFGAAGVFGQLQTALNTIWEVESKPGTGIKGFIRQRFLSLTMVLGTGFLLLVSMVLTTALTAGMGAIWKNIPMGEGIAHGLNFIVSFGVITLLFAMIFKYLPDVKIPFRVVWFGAILTAFLFTAGKYALSMYLGRESTSSPFGAAGSVIIIMMWVYYASVILLYGVEYTHAYAKVTGTEVVPSKYAVPVTEEQRAQQGKDPRKKLGKGQQHGKGVPVHANNKTQPDDGRAKRGEFDGKPAIAAAIVAEHEKRLAQEDEALAGISLGDWKLPRHPKEYVPMLLVAGLAGGLLLRLKVLRHSARIFLSTR
jgi:membrane protein